MAIKKLNDGSWRVQIQRKHIKNGKRLRRKFKTQLEAEIFQRDYLERHKPLNENDDKRTLLELIELWEKYIGISLEDTKNRVRILKAMNRDLDNPIASQLTAEQFVEYRYKRLKAVTGKTINNHHGYLNAVYNALRKLKIIDYECPTCHIQMIKLHERELSYLNHHEIEMILDNMRSHCINKSTWYVTQICIRTGARWGEAEQLKAKQVKNGKITFLRTKGKKNRTIPIEPIFYKQLKKFIGNKKSEQRIFTNCISAFRRTIYRLEKKGKIELVRGQMTHILRHTFASYYIINGGNILTLQKILGHTDIKMTMRYAHLAEDHLMTASHLNPIDYNGSSTATNRHKPP